MENAWMYVKSNTLEKRLNADRDEGMFTDVTFFVGAEKNRCKFKAHKVVLAAGNAEFENLLYGSDDSEEIEIPDVSPKAFENLIRYLYGADIQIEDLPVGRETYYAAEKFKVDKLKRATENNLIKLVDWGKVIEILQTALEFDMPVLKSKCLNIISCQFSKVCTSKEFLSNPLKAVGVILSLSKELGAEFWKHAIFTIVQRISDHKLPEDTARRMLSMICPELMPDLDILIKNRSKRYNEHEIRDVKQQHLSPKESKSLKGSVFSDMLKDAADKASLAPPEMTVPKDEMSGITVKKPSCEGEVVDQDKTSGLKDENKNAPSSEETLEQIENEDDQEEAVIGDDVINDVIEHTSEYVKDHVAFISNDTKGAFRIVIEDAMQQASTRLQKAIEDALYCFEETSGDTNMANV